MKYNWSEELKAKLARFVECVAINEHKLFEAEELYAELDPRPNFRATEVDVEICVICRKWFDCESIDPTGTCDNFERENEPEETVRRICFNCAFEDKPFKICNPPVPENSCSFFKV